MMRRVNTDIVLEVMRASGAMTGTDLIEATGLTRATVHGVCEDLVALGWVRRLENQRDHGGYVKGRPALRYELNDLAGYVLGVDMGALKVTVLLADLRGNKRARVTLPFGGGHPSGPDRVAIVIAAVRAVLAEEGIDPLRVLAAAVGAAGAVDEAGAIGTLPDFRELDDVDVRGPFLHEFGWRVLVENDANLAALAERWHGVARGVDRLIVLLAGERFGAGLVEAGKLIRGSTGAAGEMAFLRHVEGVGSTDGIARLARTWGSESLDESRDIAARSKGSPAGVTSEVVFDSAQDGDAAAIEVLNRISERVSRIVAVLATLLNPDLVVIGGAIAKPSEALLDRIRSRLPDLTPTPPRVSVSTLGEEIVALGAVRHALDHVEARSLDMRLESGGRAGA
jgi:predicted NBD/HSP70 family sugar kinase